MQKKWFIFVFAILVNIPLMSWAMGQKPANSSSGSFDYRKYDHLDPQRAVPTAVLAKAVRYFDSNRSRIRNQKYMTIIDMNQHSSRRRMYVINLQTGVVSAFTTAHGSGSDPDNDGYATRFSNTPNSRMTSLGFYLTGSQYSGQHGTSMYLHGLDSSNSKAYDRAIVMHGADYVTATRAGRSWGCPAVEKRYISTLVNILKGGSLLYIHRS